MTITKAEDVNLELGYSTLTPSERDAVPTSRKQANWLGLQRQCGRRHRSKERDNCATRKSVTGGWPGRDNDPSLKNSWGIHQWFLKECFRTYRPDANDRERCKGES